MSKVCLTYLESSEELVEVDGAILVSIEVV